ncbi:acetyl-CoA C-acetyltransferase [Psychrobacter sp. I-STPA6b]|uniref:acetyl-CoA C-acetyltransferase n=1 Tax=Psychrobacter sp. I-STPA6b TaxID=2585718 RepID=UPI001D0CD09B|nr:acetyl-CoA C-acetyltransferase [Psychrobacter sp. I-STPA6b]
MSSQKQSPIITATVVTKAGESLVDEQSNSTDGSTSSKADTEATSLDDLIDKTNSDSVKPSKADAIIAKDKAAKQKIIEDNRTAEERVEDLAESLKSKESSNTSSSLEDSGNEEQAQSKDKEENSTPEEKDSNTMAVNNEQTQSTTTSNDNNVPRRVAILGANRIPFARSNGSYANASNTDMLTAALNGLVERYDLQGERIGEVVAGAVIKLSRDLNLTRESVLNTALEPQTPAYDIAQACGTGLQATFATANKIALGIIDSAIAGGVDTTSDAPIAVGDGLRKVLLQLGAAKNNKQRLKALMKLNPKDLIEAPRNGEPRTGLSMGDHQAITALEWNISREAQDELAVKSHQNLARAYEEGFFDDLMTPYKGLTRDNNLRPDSNIEKLASLKPVFGKKGANPTMTAANSTPLTDGASCVLLGTDEWAEAHGLKAMAYLVHQETSAVDFIGKQGATEGLLMAPAYAVPRMLKRAGLTLQDFDFYEIHEAFASQVLSTLAAWEDETFCQQRLGLDAPLGAIDRSKLNVNGSSLAAGHPFAATGGRILATAAKLLDQKGSGRALISICAAGGQGVTCILEK